MFCNIFKQWFRLNRLNLLRIKEDRFETVCEIICLSEQIMRIVNPSEKSILVKGCKWQFY